MAVTKNYIGLPLMPRTASPRAAQVIHHAMRPPQRQTAVSNHAVAAGKPITNCHHLIRAGYLRFLNRRRRRPRCCPDEVSAKAQTIGVGLCAKTIPVVTVSHVALLRRKARWPM